MTTSPAESIAFTCAACGFHARLAQHYHGKAIRCPGCEAPQLVGVTAPTTQRRPTAPGKVAFDCVACGHHADISRDYAGKVVWCPGCNAVQIVPKPEPTTPPPVAAAAAGIEASAFTCQACGFQSRVVPSGVNGVVYCLACRAPQKMTADDDFVDLSSLRPPAAKPDRREIDTERIEAPATPPNPAEAETARIVNPVDAAPISDIDEEILAELTKPTGDAPAAATPSATASSLDDVLPTFADDEPAAAVAEPAIIAPERTVPAAALPTPPKAPTAPTAPSDATPATSPPAARASVASEAVTPPSLPSAKTTAKPAARPGRPGRGAGAKDAGNARTAASVQVSQRGARKVYRSVDPNAAKTDRETTDDGESAPAAAASGDAKKGLLGRLSSKFFRRGG